MGKITKMFTNAKKLEKLLFIGALLLFLFSLILLAWPNLDDDFLNFIYTNSDTLFHNYFFQEVVIEKKPLRYWTFPHSFLLTPEFFLHLLGRALAPSNPLIINIFTGISTLFVVEVSLFFLLRIKQNIFDTENSFYLATISIFNLILGQKRMGILYAILLTPHFHIGTMFNALIALLLLELLNNKEEIELKFFIPYILFVFISTFSDTLFIMYFVIPAILLQISKDNIKNLSLEAKNFKIILSTAVTSLLTFSTFTSVFLMTPTHSLKIGRGANYIPKDLFNSKILYMPYNPSPSGGIYLNNNLWLLIMIIVLSSLSLYKKGVPSFNKNRKKNIGKYLAINLILSIILYFSWGAATWIDIRSFILPILLIIFSLLANLGEYFHNKKQVVLIGAIILLLALRVPMTKKPLNRIIEKDLKTTDCLKNLVSTNKWEYGIADFWWATKLNSLSNYKVRLLPVHNAYYRHNLSKDIAMGDTKFENGKLIDFVFCGTLREKVYAIETLGTPHKVFECQNDQWVLYYENGKINDLYR